jgi:DNA (cytosine-5)-methyltransferase 1
MSLGFEQAGFDVVLGVDRDAYHCAAHHRNFPYGKTLCLSVTELSAEKVRETCGIEGDVDLVFGGPPCQGFSTMGKRNVDDPRNSLVGEFVRVIDELRPKAFVMENVPGMQIGTTKGYFDFVVETLGSLGYRITTPPRTLIATDFGAPQKRERLFVIGIREDQPRAAVYPNGAPEGQPKARNVRDAFEGLPECEGNADLFKSDTLPFSLPKQPIQSQYARVLCGLEADPTDFSYPRKSASGLFYGNKRSRHSLESIELYRATAPGSMVPGHKLPRLNPDGFSPTLRAGTESERGSHTAPRPIHPVHPRCITVREAARLHGYPDWFAFYPAVHHGFRQVGNSVSPFVARAVGRSVISALGLNFGNEKPSTVLDLVDDFPLDAARRKSEKRISHRIEFPKVINWLFEFNRNDSAIDASAVKAAILGSGANMPRVSPDEFFAELNRSRNCAEILKLPLSEGFTLVPVRGGMRFVDKDHPEGIDGSQSVGFASSDVRNYIKSDNAHSRDDALFWTTSTLQRHCPTWDVQPVTDLLGVPDQDFQEVLVKGPFGHRPGLVWRVRKGMSQTVQNIRKSLSYKDADLGIMVFYLTNHHTGLLVVEQLQGKRLKILFKKVFYSDN